MGMLWLSCGEDTSLDQVWLEFGSGLDQVWMPSGVGEDVLLLNVIVLNSLSWLTKQVVIDDRKVVAVIPVFIVSRTCTKSRF